MSWISFHPRSLTAFRGYNREKFSSDFMGGLLVAIVAALPLAIAFAVASGVSPEVGLITAILGGFIVAVLGGSSVQISGPTGSFILVVYAVVQQFGLSGLMWATLLSGLMLLLMGLFRLGSLIKFIPYPIIIGFTSGMAVVIFSTQINELLGLNIQGLPADFLRKWIAYIQNMGHIHWPTLIIGVGTIIVIQLSEKVTKRIPGSLIAIILMTTTIFLMRQFLGYSEIATIGDRFTLSGNFPAPKLLPLNFSLIAQLIQPAFTIAIIGAIESLMTATVVDSMTGERHHSNTELIAQGIANITVPFFGGMPLTGAAARTMTNVNNGGRTPMAGMIHAAIILLIYLFLMPIISYIPMACLAGVLIVVSYNMSAWRSVVSLFRGPRSDALVLVVTILLTIFFDVTIAIEVGIFLSMLFFMRRMTDSTRIHVSRDKLHLGVEGDDHQHPEDDPLPLLKGIEVYEIEGPFFFGIATHFEELTSTQLSQKPLVRIVRMRFVPFMDSTAVHNLRTLCQNSQLEGTAIILSGVSPEVHHTLQISQIEELIGPKHICDNIYTAIERANEYIQELTQSPQAQDDANT